ncbi:MAG: hypothetical protein D6767_03055 [Candidatus Hydrogenedentota bacterium]|nr:MAG: hypothetical protein D6767_03055 [Candidatus Hydrogenedentota bacterium]
MKRSQIFIFLLTGSLLWSFPKVQFGPEISLAYQSPVGGNSFGQEMKATLGIRAGGVAKLKAIPLAVSLYSGYDKYNGKNKVTFTAIPLGLNARYFIGKSAIRPYGLAGIGLLFETLKFSGSKQSNTDGLYNLGGGVAYFLGNISLRSEAFYEIYTSFAKNYQGEIDAGQVVGLRFSAVYYFSK